LQPMVVDRTFALRVVPRNWRTDSVRKYDRGTLTDDRHVRRFLVSPSSNGFLSLPFLKDHLDFVFALTDRSVF
jgi:hypothetical protein